MPSTFVGFGFGPIQTGLMLFEAFASGAFDNAVIAEVDQDLVDAVRAAGNKVSINIAGKDGVRAATLRNCLLCNPRVPADRDRLLRAIAEATEMATAVPSVDLYARGAEASIAALIAEGTRDGRPRIIYAAENNNYAAEILAEKVKEHTRGAPPENLQILNTVIGR